MKIKKNILNASCHLFNEKGVMNTTLRDVAKHLNKSYGNITYHFATKEEVVSNLLNEMNEELILLQKFDDNENIFLYLLNLPEYNYSISVKYLFFMVDYLEIKRNFKEIQKKIDNLNYVRKEKWMSILLQIKEQGYFDKRFTSNDLEYIIFLSYSIRITYFQTVEPKDYKKSEFILIVNKLLLPYLSRAGLTVFENWLSRQHK